MDYHTLSTNEVIQRLNSRSNGLTNAEVNDRLVRYGKNELLESKRKSLLVRFLSQLKDFCILILLAAALISFVTSILSGEADFSEPLIILSIVLLNAVLGVVQEKKAERSLSLLKKLSAPEAHVLREHSSLLIPASELVPGDIIMLACGSMVPADARLLQCEQFTVNESSLTGESEPVTKHAEVVLRAETPVADRSNSIYAGTIVQTGHATAIVTATGMQTEVGKIANFIVTDVSPDTPLKKQLAHTGKVLLVIVLSICVLVFLLGMRKGQPLLPMFMTAVSLGVAAIPEGLPAIVTIALSLGVQRMAKKKALVRHLPAVETLGSATFICSDKTGTLTENQMTVTELSDGYHDLAIDSREARPLCLLAALCNNARQESDGCFLGEPTEVALLRAAAAARVLAPAERETLTRLAEVPFDSARKCMSTLHRYVDAKRDLLPNLPSHTTSFLVCKGAPEVVLAKCDSCYQHGTSVPMQPSMHKDLLNYCDTRAARALRVLAVAYRPLKDSTSHRSPEKLESQLTFLGFLCLMDPPRTSVKECVRTCKQAGITPVMVTGDHALTAHAIATALDICKKEDRVITGTELRQMSDKALTECVADCRVFARVAPEHKVAIVRALQSRGEVVAMTGDGINDAPALKAADIGCSMGLSGTDVAKEASDMVLLDDNFETIVAAVKEGRSIYANIRRSVHFLLSCNIGEVITILFALLFSLPSPLLAVQLLFVNLVTDSLPAAALGVEPPEKDVMNHPPCDKKHGLFSGGLWFKIIPEGMMIGGVSLLAYVIGNRYFSNGMTMTFAVLSLSQLVHAFSMRSDLPLSEIGILTNTKLVLAFVICAVLQIMVISVPFLAGIFHVVPLTPTAWGVVAILSLLPLPLVEAQKHVTLAHAKQK